MINMRKTANSQMERAIDSKRVFTQKQLIQFVVYEELMFDRRNHFNQFDKLSSFEFPKEFKMRIADRYRTDMTVSVIKTDTGNYIIDGFDNDDSDDIPFMCVSSDYPSLSKRIMFNIDTYGISIEQKSDYPVDISDWIGSRWSYDQREWIKTEIDAKDIIDFVMNVLLNMEIRIEEFIELNRFFEESILCFDKFIAQIDDYAFLLIKKDGVYSMSLINPDVDLDSIPIPKVSVYITNQNTLWYFRVYLYDAHGRCVGEYGLDDDSIIVRLDGPYPYHDFNGRGLNRNDIDKMIAKSI